MVGTMVRFDGGEYNARAIVMVVRERRGKRGWEIVCGRKKQEEKTVSCCLNN